MLAKFASTPLLALVAIATLSLSACGADDAEKAVAPSTPVPAKAPEAAAPSAPETPAEMPRALVFSLAQFAAREPGSKGMPQPLPARLEFLTRTGGEWKLTAIEDAESNVFHKAMLYQPDGAEPKLLSVAGTEATVKLWSAAEGVLTAETLWKKDFGGRFSRMRDVELADIYGDGGLTMAVATHDKGVVATLRPDPNGGFQVNELDEEKDTFVHEIEIGDLDSDGVPEIYATPSEPNRLDGSEQSGRVVRYVPGKNQGRVVVADLGTRHAKEIFVEDVDGDGVDELYVAVEGTVKKGSRDLDQRVEIRRYESGTDATAGVVIAEIGDRLLRFLTAGDIDGDGKIEMVAAGFSSGLWLLRPGADPMATWEIESIDRDSGGFEHASILTDLDGDGTDELYVASDKHKEVRRYVWDGTKLQRETIYKRTDGRGIFTWNIMPVPVSIVPAGVPASDG